MKIIRFQRGCNSGSYAYVKCWPWETFAILRKMKKRKTGILKVTWQPGPKAWGAKFMLSPIYRRLL